MKRIAFGRTADVYELDGDRVLKLYRPGWSRTAIDRERDISILAHEAGLSTPRCFGNASAEGRDGLIFERARGPSMLTLFSRQPWRVLELSRQFADLHARINSVRFERRPSFKDEIGARIAEASGDTERYRAAALEALGGLAEGASLLHGDFHPDNVIMTENGPTIIDWMTGSSGPPVADVARSVVIIKNGATPSEQGAAMKLLTRIGRMASVGAYLRHYAKHQAIPKTELDQWRLPLLVARLALGIPGEKPLIENELGRLLPP